MKLSLAALALAALSYGAEEYVVVRVSSPEYRYVINRSGARDMQHPDLRPDEVLVAATERQLEALRNEPAVSLLYPASPELVSVAPVHACASTMDETQIGAFTLMGKGWDTLRLTYTFENISPKIGEERFTEAVQRAMAEWSRWVRVDFVPGSRTDGRGNLNFLFASGSHGDRYPFDGPRKTLAHTFYPNDVNPEPIAGDLHFDEDENWQSGFDPDFYSVVLHELGHALGLGHSLQPKAVMYPYYRKFDNLQDDDINAVRKLYPERILEEAPAPPEQPVPADEHKPEQPQPSSPQPTSPQPQQPDPPKPTETLPTAPAANTSDKTAPTLRITSPTVAVLSTSAGTIKITGTAADNTGVVEVKWTAPGGRSGVAHGTTNWTIPDLELRRGDNSIIIRAYDRAGNYSWRSLSVTRN